MCIYCIHGELRMMLRPFPMFIAMLLMLAIGVGLGVLITTSHRSPKSRDRCHILEVVDRAEPVNDLS